MTDRNPKARSEPVPQNKMPVNQAAKRLLGPAADPTTLYLLQLAEKGLDDPALKLAPPNRRALAQQLEALNSAPPDRAMAWLVPKDQDVELPESAQDAALMAAQHLESRTAAERPGYPPTTRHAMI